MGVSCSLDTIPKDILFHILGFNNFMELCNQSKICVYLDKIIKNNDIMWKKQCFIEWKNKVYIPIEYQKLIGYNNPKTNKYYINKSENIIPESKENITNYQVFKLAYLDRKRTVITLNEMSNIKWYLHFKRSSDYEWNMARISS